MCPLSKSIYDVIASPSLWSACPPPCDDAELPAITHPGSTTQWFAEAGIVTTIAPIPLDDTARQKHGMTNFAPQQCRAVTIAHKKRPLMHCLSWLETPAHSTLNQHYGTLANQPLGHMLFSALWQRQPFRYTHHATWPARRSDFIHRDGSRLHLVEFFCIVTAPVVHAAETLRQTN